MVKFREREEWERRGRNREVYGEREGMREDHGYLNLEREEWERRGLRDRKVYG